MSRDFFYNSEIGQVGSWNNATGVREARLFVVYDYHCVYIVRLRDLMVIDKENEPSYLVQVCRSSFLRSPMIWYKACHLLRNGEKMDIRKFSLSPDNAP